MPVNLHRATSRDKDSVWTKGTLADRILELTKTVEIEKFVELTEIGKRYIRAGGGYAGIHAAADTEYDWAWYGGLVGAYFRNHPAGTPTASDSGMLTASTHTPRPAPSTSP